MFTLTLKPTDKAVKKYYQDLQSARQLHLMHEGSVAPAFADLLSDCARRLNYHLSEQYPHKRLRFDGAILTNYNVRIGVWEAKDEADDLEVEIQRKLNKGYPHDNILFQAPDRAILIQNGSRIGEFDLTQPDRLTRALEAFFNYRVPEFDNWEQAVVDFKAHVPDIARTLIERIDSELKTSKDFKAAFSDLYELAKTSLNPNLSADAVKEMIVQHLMTERIFRKVFNNPDFVRRNAIAQEIERVVEALMQRHFNREAFFKPLEPFYQALERAAATISDYSEKQSFLNTVYEQFFQGFSVKTADTHGIVYTPQSIVSFMVKSVEQLLQREFGRSLADEGVHILDPFVGTGNFILRVIEEIRQAKPSALPHKYRHELHANELMLLPYYIASMNIEHAYYEAMGEYEPFPGVCLVDTFELYEGAQRSLPGFGGENVARVQAQQRSPITVVIGNPPYNVGQANENDNNKNRQYPKLDRRVQETYSKASRATSRSKLNDPYVKAFRWASDRIGEEGVVAFVSNNSFLDNIAFDGMRQHLAADFDAIYHLNLKGNARTSGERRRREGGNIFDDLIRVGIGITFLVRRKDHQGSAHLYVYNVDDYLRGKDKRAYLERAKSLSGVAWQVVQPNAQHVWLTEGLQDDWAGMLPLGTKEGKAGKDDQTIFGSYSLGMNTNRDSWVYSYQYDALEERIQLFIETYNTEVDRWANRVNKQASLDNFVLSDEKRIKWSSRLKERLLQRQKAEYSPEKIRAALYRPFTRQYLYFDDILNHRQGQFPRIFPTPQTEAENRVICVSGIGSSKPFMTLISNTIPCLDLLEKTQCFPLYVYDEDGTNRRENVTDWGLRQFQQHYGDESITKEDIFYYVYGALHDPAYRERYAANLKRELPRLPFRADFWATSRVGRALADLHLNYEQLTPYPLTRVEDPKRPPSERVEKMKLITPKDGESNLAVQVNPFLRLEGVPRRALDYKLGSRSALEWVIEQYRVTTDARSGITNDPNRPDDAGYIVRLIGQVVRVSLETLALVETLTVGTRPASSAPS